MYLFCAIFEYLPCSYDPRDARCHQRIILFRLSSWRTRVGGHHIVPAGCEPLYPPPRDLPCDPPGDPPSHATLRSILRPCQRLDLQPIAADHVTRISTHSANHQPSHPTTYLFNHSVTYPMFQPSTHLATHLAAHASTYPVTHQANHLANYSATHPAIRPATHTAGHSKTYLVTLPAI